MPALATNLVRIGATYTFRSRIPQDLLSYYQPKKEVTESLRTKSLADAKRLLPALAIGFRALGVGQGIGFRRTPTRPAYKCVSAS